jgi:putative aminopeptidase FrvX
VFERMIDHAWMAAVQRAQQVDRVSEIACRGARRAHRANERVACAAIGIGERGKHAPSGTAAIK